MPRILGALLGAVALTVAAFAVPAGADPVDPNFLSKLNSIKPKAKGLEVKIVNLGDEIQVSNETGKNVLVEGYTGEPYLRFKADGTVQENQNSPATYLNKDRYATKKVPDSADAKAKPDWKVVSRDGSYEWHDHRIHYMGKGTPSQVKDESERQKVYDWKVTLRQGDKPIVVSGTLFWVPTAGAGDDGGLAAWQIAIGAVLIALAAGLALLMINRRRRRPAPAVAGTGGMARPRQPWEPPTGAAGFERGATQPRPETEREKPGKEAW